jgi:hypothetical protein
VLFVANRNQLFALKEGAMTKPAAASLLRPRQVFELSARD